MPIMLPPCAPPPDSAAAPDPSDLAAVVMAIGSDRFAARLLGYLDGIIGAGACALYRVMAAGPERIGAAHRAGAAPIEMTPVELRRLLRQAEPHAAVRLLAAGGSRGDQVLVCGRQADAAYCIGVVPAAQARLAPTPAVAGLRGVAGLLIAVIAKHADLVAQRPNMTPALSALPEIQGCILAATDLSRREAEVCARALYGMTSIGIALDLGIGKESVMTYRKRAYHRLGIGSQRELLMWYLALWSDAERRTEDGDGEATETWAAPRRGAPALPAALPPLAGICGRTGLSPGKRTAAITVCA